MNAIDNIILLFLRHSRKINRKTWQAQNVEEVPEAVMKEMLHTTLRFDIVSDQLDDIARFVKPNQPWVDDHFQERVCGSAINPGREWKNWPWGHSAESHLNSQGMFNHNYMERYWPKYRCHSATQVPADFTRDSSPSGFHGGFGDLNDLINHMANNPLTRQAYLPVWFPEDTGDMNSGRKPCTLGYHFIRNEGKLDVVYYIRSCDVYRHFRDDIYLTIRLLLWIISHLRVHGAWTDVRPGQFIMHITSLHCFINDFHQLEKEYGPNQ